MPDDRLIRILSQLTSDDLDGEPTRLCTVCAEVTEMSGAGIMLLSGSLPLGSVCTSNEVSNVIEELQYTLGEGPCIDAHRLNTPVGEPDLVNPSTPRWTAFSVSAAAAGARAIFGFPVAVGPVVVGALDLYRDQPGPLTEDQHATALVVAGVAARAILNMQTVAEPGELGPQLEASGNYRFVVHQASGMISVQVGIPVDDAQARLRAHAWAVGRTVSDVAEDVVAGRLRFDTIDRDGC